MIYNLSKICITVDFKQPIYKYILLDKIELFYEIVKQILQLNLLRLYN